MSFSRTIILFFTDLQFLVDDVVISSINISSKNTVETILAVWTLFF